MLKSIPQQALNQNELPVSVALRGSSTQLVDPARPTLMIGIPEIGAKAKDTVSPVPQLKSKVERTAPRVAKPTVKLPIAHLKGRESPFLDVVQRSRAAVDQ